MFVEPVIGYRDVGLVPAGPIVALVAADEQDGLPYQVEREQDSDLCPSCRSWPELLHVAVAASLDRVDQWTAERRSLISQHADRR
jgi:hypothetical protein